MPKGYHVLLGWNLKGIRETFGVPIYDRQLAVCVSTPIESMIPKQELSPRILVSLRSNPVTSCAIYIVYGGHTLENGQRL
jgi:hypothetical protein